MSLCFEKGFILIHQYKQCGMNIVLDENSGAVHVVDDLTYDLIGRIAAGKTTSKKILSAVKKDFPKASDKDIAEACGEIKELSDNGDLFTEDPYEDSIERFAKHPTVVKALCLHVAHDCNLNCVYCFAGQGEYHGPKGLMSYETGCRALDFVVSHCGGRTNIEVDFFGGEPLMNWDVVKRLVAYGRGLEKKTGKHSRFTITTNGVLITDEVIDFCNREMDNVVLSIDGRPEVHDRMRPTKTGTGSIDIILPKLKKFASSREALGKEYYVRGTYTHYNLDFAKDVLWLADQGFHEISVEPVVADPSNDYAIRKEDIPVLLEQYDILAKEMQKRRGTKKDFNFYHFMIDLEGGPCVYKRLSGCGSGSEYLAVTPEGDLYPCHLFVGEPEFLLGDVWRGVEKTDLVESFKKCNVYEKPECRTCFARYYCSGGCAANAYHANGDIHMPYEIGCELQRKRVECAIALKADAALSE